jgi:predicted Rossmann fold flavoprotein
MGTDVDIAVVGAGAAGLAAAIFAAQAQPGLKIVLLDGARRVGAKILVSGGGRCNVTHARVTTGDFHAPHRAVERVLQRFDEQATVSWFESLGVVLKQEPTGKLFPVSDSSRTVLEALLARCEALGLSVLTEHRVSDIRPKEGGFEIVHDAGCLVASRVIMATGGRSLPKTGSDGLGWEIIKRLGHTVTATQPALVPLVLGDTFFHAGLSGISHEAEVMTRVEGKTIDRRTGSLLWTHFGVSGPVVMDASRFWVMADAQGRDTTVSISLLPGETFEAVDRWLTPTDKQALRKTVAATLAQRLPRRVVKAMCTYVGAMARTNTGRPKGHAVTADPGATALSQLPRDTRPALTQALTDLPLPVLRSRGWNEAEVTAGGVPLKEMNLRTMASRPVPGLYLVGEMLDCDGRIGGFNFQWAWATGHIAGRSAALLAVSPTDANTDD